ncbi:MAG: tRNA pseudouridine(38-40) synthase TruA [Candidatus Aminicenantes bacterium]|nr:tRNA pseudouridine(38-40) synthase TruA [Candidatus Aminicenantes bacterium]
MMKNYKITVSYDGTDYHGWQVQPQKQTIQGLIQDALYLFKSKRIKLIGAGRTDAGVHAAGQVAHFKADLDYSNQELLNALNGNLPPDIRIIKVENVDMDFHSLKNARTKIYQYRIINAPDISPFDIRYTLHLPSALNLIKMNEAASRFIRKHDFTSFSSNRLRQPVKNVIRSEIKKKGPEIVYKVEADGFLKYMVRTIVGALIAAGKDKLTPDEIDSLFKHRKRSVLTPTAPAKGLCLIKVKY